MQSDWLDTVLIFNWLHPLPWFSVIWRHLVNKLFESYCQAQAPPMMLPLLVLDMAWPAFWRHMALISWSCHMSTWLCLTCLLPVWNAPFLHLKYISWYFWNGHNYTSKRTFGLLGLGGFPLLHRIILSITVNQMLFNQTHLAWHFPGEVCFRNEVCAAWQRAHKHLCRMTFPNIGSWPLRLVSLTWWVR